MQLPIKTARLVLRRFQTKDIAGFQSYRSDPEVERYQGWQSMSDEIALEFVMQQMSQVLGPEGQWLQIAMALHDSDQLIGDFGICVRDEQAGLVEIGFSLSRPSQGQGYASEALKGLLEALFADQQYQRVKAVTDTRNTASIALLKRVGFGYQHTEPAMFKGQPCVEETYCFDRPALSQIRAGSETIPDGP